MKYKVSEIVYGRERNTLWCILETVIISAIFVSLSLYLRPTDPLFISGPFPWVIFAPILISLLYGLRYGIIAFAIIIGALIKFEPSEFIQSSIARYYLLGSALFILLCGEFSIYWRGKIKEIEQINQYICERLDHISRAYYTVRISHDRLEHSLISNPVTLRSCIYEMRKLLVKSKGILNEATGKEFVVFLSQYTGLDQAALFSINNNKVDKMLGFVGSKVKLYQNDVLIERCLASSKTQYFSINQLKKDEESHYMLTSAMKTSSGDLIALLVVEKINFWSLNEENIEILSVLMSYYADEVEAIKTSKEIIAAYPDCPIYFASELYKLTRLKREINTDSSITAIIINHEITYNDMMMSLIKMQRGLDYYWHKKNINDDILITLMPFSNMSSAEGYVNRMKRHITEHFGIKHFGNKIIFRTIQIDGGNGLNIIKKLMMIVKKYNDGMIANESTETT